VLSRLSPLRRRFRAQTWLLRFSWTSLDVAIAFLGGVQLVCIGEYIARTYEHMRRMPPFCDRRGRSGGGSQGARCWGVKAH